MSFSTDKGKVVEGGGSTIKMYGVAYLKPNEVLKGSTYDKAYKIIYE